MDKALLYFLHIVRQSLQSLHIREDTSNFSLRCTFGNYNVTSYIQKCDQFVAMAALQPKGIFDNNIIYSFYKYMAKNSHNKTVYKTQ